MATYLTKQQTLVRDCIAAQTDRCVSAAALAEELRARGARIGVATIYRQLEKLEKQGVVHKVVTEEGAYYRYCPQREAHGCFLLRCERCGRIEHADCEKLAPLYRHLEEEHRFSINPRRTMFYGLCAACREGSSCAE